MSWPEAITWCTFFVCLTLVLRNWFEIEFRDDDKEGQ